MSTKNFKVKNGLEVAEDLTVAGAISGNIAASNINSGTLGSARIPQLDASKIATGTMSADVLPDATLTTPGITRLENSTSSTGTDVAATANSVRVVKELADSKINEAQALAFSIALS